MKPKFLRCVKGELEWGKIMLEFIEKKLLLPFKVKMMRNEIQQPNSNSIKNSINNSISKSSNAKIGN